MAAQTRLIYEFDDFQLEPDERKLLRRGQVVPLHGKAFELLLALIRNRGRLLTKDEIFELVWPDQIVEESNLTVNMSAIRRALGERANSPRYITTISGRGYRFTGEVRQFADEALTIERESFARVTVEQEETESISLLPSAVQITKAVRRLTAHPVMLCVMGGLVVTLTIGSLWLKSSLLRASAPLPWTNVTMHRFTTNGGVPFRVAVSPDGKSIAYVQRVNGKPSLWLGQIETNSSVLIGDQSDIAYDGITFSRDGQSIYVSELDKSASITKLVRVPAVGGVPAELATNIDNAVTLSPDGRQLAFLRRGDGQSSIIITDADGKNERSLAARTRPENFSGNGLSWSPDGKNIAVAASGGENKPTAVLTISVADGSARKIGKHDLGYVSNLVWQSDGSGLLSIVRSSPIARRSEIWFVPYPDGEARKITNDLNQYYGETMSLSASDTLAVLHAEIESEIWVAPDGDHARARVALQGVATRYEGIDGLAWAPDGHLLYSGYVGDGQVIWQMTADGLNRKQLTSAVGDSVDRQMSVTGDNRFIVFQSNRSGNVEIWRANCDGTSLKQLTSGANNSQPSLSPDGKWIVYESEQNGVSTLWRISIEGGELTQLTRNSASRPQVSPDGKHIAYLESSDSTPLHLSLMSFDGQPEKAFPLPGGPTTNVVRTVRWTPDGKAILYKASAQGLWRQRLDHDKPEPVKGFDDVQIYRLAWSLDGKTLAYTRGVNLQEIVLLQNSK